MIDNDSDDVVEFISSNGIDEASSLPHLKLPIPTWGLLI